MPAYTSQKYVRFALPDPVPTLVPAPASYARDAYHMVLLPADGSTVARYMPSPRDPATWEGSLWPQQVTIGGIPVYPRTHRNYRYYTWRGSKAAPRAWRVMALALSDIAALKLAGMDVRVDTRPDSANRLADVYTVDRLGSQELG